MPRRRTLLWMGLVMLLSVACSMRNTAYRWADTFLVREIDSYFDLTSAQHAFVKQRLTALLSWHRQEELPRYASLLAEARSKAADGITREEVDWFFETSRNGGRRLAEHIAPDAGEFLSLLNPSQLAPLERELQKRNAKQEKKLAEGLDEYIDSQVRGTGNTLRVWLGTLSDSQLQMFKNHTRNSYEFAKERFLQKKKVQQDFLRFLRARPTAEQAREQFLNWMLEPQRLQTEDFREKQRANHERFVSFILALDRTLSEKQRAHLLRETERLEKDMLELAKGEPR